MSSSDAASFIKSTHKIQLPIVAASAQTINSATGVTLQNGAQIIVLTDTTTKMSFAAAAVAAGSNWDPAETPGLAHLCEHMLFLGTKRDPEEGAFDKFLSENAGSSNAWTEDGTTNYHFQCTNSAFEEALIRFSHFFVEPTMTPSGLEREVQAVHSEDEKNHTIDYWCQQEMMKENLVDKRHPYSRYGNGNAETLWDGPKKNGVDLHATLMKYYEQHYVAENMAFVIYSPLSSEQVINEIMIPVLKNTRVGPGANPKRNVQSFSHLSDCLIAKESLGTWTNMKTHGHIQKLHVVFPFRTTKKLADDNKIWSFVNWLIGHECRGSIVDVLRKEVYSTSVTTDETGVDDENYQMTISVYLTAKGLRCIDSVIDIIFAGIHFLKKQSLNHPARIKKIFEEAVACDRLAFHSQEVPGDLDEHVATLAQNCIAYTPERCWCATELVDEMNKEKIDEAFNYLSDAKNAYFILDLHDPDKLINDSLYCQQHPEVLEKMLKAEAEEGNKMIEVGGKNKHKKGGHGHEDDDDDDAEEDEEFDEDGEETDEEWQDCDSNEEVTPEDNNKEEHNHHHHHHHHNIKKILPIQTLSACAQLATETTSFHKAKHSKPTKIDESLLTQWSRDRTRKELNGLGFALPNENPFICSVREEDTTRNTPQNEDEDGDNVPPSHQQQKEKDEIFINPKTIHTSKWGKVLFQEFKNGVSSASSPILQRAQIIVSINSPYVYSSPKHRFFARTLVFVLSYAMAELTYFAQLGSLHIHQDASFQGLHYAIEGPQEKLFVLVKALIRQIFGELFGYKKNDNASNENKDQSDDDEDDEASKELQRVLINPEKYRACADRVLRKIQSLDIEAPYEQAEDWLYQYRFEKRYHHSLDILESINNTVPPFEEFLNFTQNVIFAEKVSYEILVVSTPSSTIRDEVKNLATDFLEDEIIENTICKQQQDKEVVPATAEDFADLDKVISTPSRAELQKYLDFINKHKAKQGGRGATSPKKNNEISSPPFGTFISEMSTTTKTQPDPNSACVVSFYFGKSSPYIVAMTDIISSLIETQYYNNLRTKETLGYIVYGYTSTLEGHRFLRLVAQSAEQDSWYLFSRTFAFLHAIQDQIFLMNSVSVAEDGSLLPQRREREGGVAAASASASETNSSSSPSISELYEKLERSIRSSAESHAAECRDKPKNISELAERVWELRTHPYGYHIQFDAAKILDDETQITVENVQKFFKKHFLDAEDTRVLISLVHGSEDKELCAKGSSKTSSPTTRNALPNIFTSMTKKIAQKVETNKNAKDKDEEGEEDDDENVPPPPSADSVDVVLSDFGDDITDEKLKNVSVMVATKDRETYKKFVSNVQQQQK